MGDIIIGSARIDEQGRLKGGKAGDQKQTSVDDYKGEVSMQKFYVHSKGWYVFRAKNQNVRLKLAQAMKIACNNPNIGYDQNQRLGILSYGVGSTKKTECDCSSLVRQCIIESAGVDLGNFTTGTFPNKAKNSGLFEFYEYRDGFRIETGDILCTKTKGHMVICVVGFTTPGQVTLEHYNQAMFIADVERILKVTNVNSAFEKSIVISRTVNKNHSLVTPLERYMRSLGYYTGKIEADIGKTPSFGRGMESAIKLYQSNYVKSGIVDGIISRKGYTWKKLLGLN